MKRVLIIAIIVVLIVGGLTFRFVLKQRKGMPEAVASTVKAVEVISASRGEIRFELQLSGTIEANSQVTVFPKTAGTVIQMAVDEGSRVTKGEVLAIVEHEELELQVRQAEAAYQAAKTAYEQARALAEIRVKSQIAQTRAQLDAAQASFQQVEDLAEIRAVSQIEQAEAGLISLQANLEKIERGAREEDRQQAQAAVEQAKANLANAQSNYQRMRHLFENGAISQQSFEGAQTQLDIARAQHKVATEQLRLIENGAREEDVKAMEAQVAQAEAALKLARAQAETKSWEKDTALAKSQVEAAQAALQNAEALAAAKSWEAEIISAETAVTQAKAALDLARKRLADATVTAPINGIVSARHLNLGDMASPTTPIFDIVDMNPVKAVVSVIESDLGKLKTNDWASIQVDALADPVNGKITLISPTIERSSRMAKVEITIENPEMALKPGMFAKVSIPVEIHQNAILIPRSAVIEDNDRNIQTVFVVADGRSERKQVEFGLSQGSTVEIAKGLSEGEQVVIAGQHSLKDGETVTVVNP